MIERNHRLGHLVFDRDAIVRAALRAYIEALFGDVPLRRLSFPASAGAMWAGDLQRGTIYNDDRCGNYDVVAWTETGVVGLAYELGWGPIAQLGLSPDAVTGGPNDVRGAVPGLPDELEPAFLMAVDLLATREEVVRKGEVYAVYKERLAGVGFWLHGDRIAGTLFDNPTACGAHRLAAWGMLRGGRLWPLYSNFDPRERAIVVERARKDAAMHALIDAVVDRRMRGPTELTADELAMLFPTPPKPETLLYAQRMLAKVGITWPGSPEIPPE